MHISIHFIHIFTCIHKSYYCIFNCCSQGRGERAYDIFSRLQKERIVCLMGPVSPTLTQYTHLIFSTVRDSYM